MAGMIKKIKDREVFLFNPITGQLDLALEFNASRLVTCKRNSAGEIIQEYDLTSDTYTDNSHDVVTDRFGNVLSAKFIDGLVDEDEYAEILELEETL